MNIRLDRTKKYLERCAELMAGSRPWKELYFSKTQCISLLSSQTLEIYVATATSEVLGFIATRRDGMEGEPLLEYLCVAPEHRDKGIGTGLINFADTEVFGDAANVYLFVSDINPRAIGLYERLGFERVGELPNYNLWGQTEYIYRKFRHPRQERFVPETTLTSQQVYGSVEGVYDLNSGYAQLPVTSSMLAGYLASTSESMKVEFDQSVSGQRLDSAIRELLSIPDARSLEMRFTFSGSIALDRVFTAVRMSSRDLAIPKVGLTAIVPEPSIDLWQLLLKERYSIEQYHDLQIKGVHHNFRAGEGRIGGLVDEIETQYRRAPNRQLLVVLDSPSNPLGLVTTEEELLTLARCCGECGAILVVDHCFQIAGLHYPDKVPSVFSLGDTICDWIGIWDTGKSIDLAGDKLGVIVPGSLRMKNYVDASLSVIQPYTFSAKRTIASFSSILSDPSLPAYLARAGSTCHQNLRALSRGLPNGWEVNSPTAGTFACVYSEDSEMGSDEMREYWLRRMINVAASRTFFRSSPNDVSPFVRVSLYRNPSMFKQAIGQLRESTH